MKKIDNLDDVLKENDLVVLLFSGEDCAGCETMEKRLDEIEGMFSDVVFVSVSVDDSLYLASHLPVILFLANAMLVDTLIGAVSSNRIKDKLTALVRMGG